MARLLVEDLVLRGQINDVALEGQAISVRGRFHRLLGLDGERGPGGLAMA
jgi:hypothetical protein